MCVQFVGEVHPWSMWGREHKEELPQVNVGHHPTQIFKCAPLTVESAHKEWRGRDQKGGGRDRRQAGGSPLARGHMYTNVGAAFGADVGTPTVRVRARVARGVEGVDQARLEGGLKRAEKGVGDKELQKVAACVELGVRSGTNNGTMYLYL
jgi:hypothetical protein